MMKPGYEEIMLWMKEYFSTYNAYAQSPETVDRMGDYFTPDVRFVPYVSAFGGPDAAITSRDEFFRMFTSHPTVYEKFDVEDIVVDEKRMVTTALLAVVLYESGSERILVRKHYLPRYQLVLDEKNRLKISEILFFWEATPPEVDEAYAIRKAE